MTRKLISSILILFSVIFISCNSGGDNSKADSTQKKKISVIFPATIDAFENLKLGLNEICKDSFEIRYFSAEGDKDKFETTIQSALLTKPDYIVAIGSQITNAAFAAKFRDDLPIVISGAISAPESVDALVKAGVNPKRKLPVAIVSDNPKEDIYSLFSKRIKEFLPKVSKVGILYNNSEINSKETADKITSQLKNSGFTVIDGVINNFDDVDKITTSLLVNGAEVIIIPHDKYAVTKAASIVKQCSEKGIPVFSLDDGTVRKDGVSVAVSVNYRIIGQMIGKTIATINSKNEKAEDLPIVQLNQANTYVNIGALKKLNIKIPDTLNTSVERY